MILLTSNIVSLISAYLSFGPQADVGILPGAYFVNAYASLLFFSVAFMVGELLRRASLAYIFASALLFASTILGFYMDLIYTLTRNEFYATVQIYLPSSPVSSLPVQYISSNIPSVAQQLLSALPIGGSVEPSILQSLFLILAYSTCATVILVFYFRYADVSRRVS